MLNAEDLVSISKGAVVAPAGHGKTELIAKVAGLGRRALILTHTHAGVHALRERLKRLKIPHKAAAVDTIAGWCMRYAHAFPKVAQPCDGMPQGREWDLLYEGTIRALQVPAVRQVIEASYDRILIDEYQDCHLLQHELANALSTIVPTLVFGDPMQGIFEFAGSSLSWDREVFSTFPLVDTLDTPYRWKEKNPELGRWVAFVRERLIRGEDIDLSAWPASFQKSGSAFDMAPLFESFDVDAGESVAAIHCNKGVCYRLAGATAGGYQAIEEIAARRLMGFCDSWDSCESLRDRTLVMKAMVEDCFNIRPLASGEEESEADNVINAEIGRLRVETYGPNAAAAGVALFGLIRRRSRYRLFRGELWRDAERVLTDVADGRSLRAVEAADRVRQRTTLTGRRLPRRTVSTPLLLKGLEFDHVVVPDATHFANEQLAQAKLFYVAISRATRSLTLTARDANLRLPPPKN